MGSYYRRRYLLRPPSEARTEQSPSLRGNGHGRMTANRSSALACPLQFGGLELKMSPRTGSEASGRALHAVYYRPNPNIDESSQN